MSMPFYVSPEQLMKDRADYARKGISRGRPVIAASSQDGILFVTVNPASTLYKTSELYDRIGFAAVGKYNEFESLRVAGIRYADLRGFSYNRSDVNARGLANTYAQTLGAVFTTESKPLEVELVVAQVNAQVQDDEFYRLSFDGSVAQERNFVVMGAQAEAIHTGLEQQWDPDLTLGELLGVSVQVLSQVGQAGVGPDAAPEAGVLEVSLLRRTAPRRAFERLSTLEISQLLQAGSK